MSGIVTPLERTPPTHHNPAYDGYHDFWGSVRVRGCGYEVLDDMRARVHRDRMRDVEHDRRFDSRFVNGRWEHRPR